MTTQEMFEHLKREYEALLKNRGDDLTKIELDNPGLFPPGTNVMPLSFSSEFLKGLTDTEVVELYHFALNTFSEKGPASGLSGLAVSRSAADELNRRGKNELLKQ